MTGYIKNKTNMQRLLDWLEQGAPTVTFNMYVGVAIYGNEHGTGECNTSCCIAGAAAQMQAGTFGDSLSKGDLREKFSDGGDIAVGDSAWNNVPHMAIDFLGIDVGSLPPQDLLDQWDDGYVLDLFRESLAPENCTPAQAAQAIRNFDKYGNARWDTVE